MRQLLGQCSQSRAPQLRLQPLADPIIQGGSRLSRAAATYLGRQPLIHGGSLLPRATTTYLGRSSAATANRRSDYLGLLSRAAATYLGRQPLIRV
jgi:hypothetical protein